jgi:flagellar secretion chaperone FliS
MMQATQLADRYLQEQVTTASPEQLMLMLYDGAIRFLRVARKAMAEKDIAKTHQYLLKAQNIITELMSTLDFEVGGEVARNLYRLYDYYVWALVQANIKQDPAPIEDVITHLKNLKLTWEEAIAQVHKAKPTPTVQESAAPADANPADTQPTDRTSTTA